MQGRAAAPPQVVAEDFLPVAHTQSMKTNLRAAASASIAPCQTPQTRPDKKKGAPTPHVFPQAFENKQDT
jgi:hypothetical protein